MNDWHAYYTRSRAEKAVNEKLRQQAIEVFLPLYTVVRKWSDRKKEVEEPLIRGYIFARPIDTKQHYSILNTFGIVRCLWYDGKPALIPDVQIEVLRNVMKERMEVEPAPAVLIPGQKVVILEGSLAGREGELVQIAGRHRVVLRIDHIDQALLVTIHPKMVRPVNQSVTT